MKPPLLLNFVNKSKYDWRKENLELLCYNCYFLYIANPLTEKMVKAVESLDYENEHVKEELEEFHQLDQVYLDHLKSLGLDDEGDVIEMEESEDLIDFDDGSDLIDLI